MGCNFNSLKGDHIGKRSAAGLYCWDCKQTLCKEGEKNIHEDDEHSHWYKRCPKCGQKPAEETLSENAAGRELGFNKKPPGKKTGVKSCSSFTWAIEPVRLKTIKKITDEYGRTYSINSFKKILEECPVQFFDSVGQVFS